MHNIQMVTKSNISFSFISEIKGESKRRIFAYLISRNTKIALDHRASNRVERTRNNEEEEDKKNKRRKNKEGQKEKV